MTYTATKSYLHSYLRHEIVRTCSSYPWYSRRVSFNHSKIDLESGDIEKFWSISLSTVGLMRIILLTKPLHALSILRGVTSSHVLEG